MNADERNTPREPARRGLVQASTLAGQGRFKSALELLRQVHARYPQAQRDVSGLMASILAVIDPGRYVPELEADLLFCLGHSELDLQPLAELMAGQLLDKHALSERVVGDGEAMEELSRRLGGDRLLLSLLSELINVSPTLERFLIGLRGYFLDWVMAGAELSGDRRRLMVALAIQCHLNEHLYGVAEGERPALLQLQQGAASPEARWLTLALYEPLSAPAAEALRELSVEEPLVARLLAVGWDEPRRLRELAGQLPGVGSLANPASQSVRAQYEENPYPRWRGSPSARPAPIGERLARLPGYRGATPPERGQLLVAGCGTGYEPLSLALADPQWSITAIDFSRHSLAYGALRAKDLGVTNVSFVQADILELEALPGPFDLVVCTGVLHHLDDPLAGWRQLLAQLRPGGVMRLGLYSALGRRRIARARELITERGLAPTPRDMRAFREEILQAPADSWMGELAQSSDLYSLSGCRDLLFHAREHHFRLPELSERMAELGLSVIGVEPPAGLGGQALSSAFPDRAALCDLHRWDALEQRHPDLFVGMYHLWLQKPG